MRKIYQNISSEAYVVCGTHYFYRLHAGILLYVTFGTIRPFVNLPPTAHVDALLCLQLYRVGSELLHKLFNISISLPLLHKIHWLQFKTVLN